jgi:hypothetical protein
MFLGYYIYQFVLVLRVPGATPADLNRPSLRGFAFLTLGGVAGVNGLAWLFTMVL